MIFSKYKFTFLGIAVGGIAGYFYWHFYGCTEGCNITSVWWRSSIYGAFMGGLLLNMFESKKEA